MRMLSAASRAANQAPTYLFFLKQHPQRLRHPIHNHQLPANLCLPLPLIRSAIPNIYRLKVKALKHPPDIRVVIDTDHHLPFAAAHEIRHPFVVLKRKVHPIPCGLPVRRVHVVKRMWPVIPFSTLKPGQVLHISARQALPSRRQIFLNPQQVDGKRSINPTNLKMGNAPS